MCSKLSSVETFSLANYFGTCRVAFCGPKDTLQQKLKAKPWEEYQEHSLPTETFTFSFRYCSVFSFFGQIDMGYITSWQPYNSYMQKQKRWVLKPSHQDCMRLCAESVLPAHRPSYHRQLPVKASKHKLVEPAPNRVTTVRANQKKQKACHPLSGCTIGEARGSFRIIWLLWLGLKYAKPSTQFFLLLYFFFWKASIMEK